MYNFETLKVDLPTVWLLSSFCVWKRIEKDKTVFSAECAYKAVELCHSWVELSCSLRSSS